MKLIPASSAAWMMRIDSSWSGSPQAPNIIAPRHSLLTETPVRPSWRVLHRVLLSVVSRRRGVLVVADVASPRDRAAGLVVLLHGDVDHEAIRCGAVPVVLARLEVDAVAGADDLDRAALALTEPDALRDEDRLAVRVRVPCGPGAGSEADVRRRERRGPRRRGDGVDVD